MLIEGGGTMHTARVVTRFTEAQYLALESASEDRHEFLDGQILGMAGASQRHVDTCSNIERVLGAALGPGCRATGADQRVYVASEAMYTYPDVTVACEPREHRRLREGTALVNPRVLVEVLSSSTRAYDLGEKLTYYQTIPSLTDILLVDHVALRIVHWTRQGDGWSATERDHGLIALVGLPIALAVEDAFRDIAPADRDLD
jgi:Uma2 family endonuclease